MSIHQITSYLSSKTKKTNLYLITITTVLCSISYLTGIYQQGTTTPSITITTTTNLPCTTPPPTLDFTTHHTADNTFPLSSPARVVKFPPCSPKLSEYTPCQDVDRSLKFDREMLVYRERHCPVKEEMLQCMIPAPAGYKLPFRWPESRESVWYANVPHKHLTVEKEKQNWVRFGGDRFTFPGGGTMFPRGADVYIDEIAKLVDLGNGLIRTAIDTGCGVASWGAYLMSRDILPMSFAPKDTHEAQVQFALERGVPAMLGIMASNRLPYPSRAFDMAHCSRCLVPWGAYDGLYLIEVDRILRPGGYWILSGPPVNWEAHWRGWNRTREDLKAEQDGIESVARSLCWRKLVQRNDLAIWQKATNHMHCKINRKVFKKPPFCKGQDPDKAWYTKMEACLTPLPEVSIIKDVSGGQLARWPERLTTIPPRILSGSIEGVTAETFKKNTKLWKKRLSHYKSIDYQLAEVGRYRNLLDMNAYLGGFAAALVDYPVWVLNVVPVEAEVNTLGVVYERGLIGTYQNWCEAMSTYPRTYDFIHADSIFTLYKDRCEMEDILLEMDRVLRPQGSVIIRDDVDILINVKKVIEGLQWDCRMTDHEESAYAREKILVATKEYWTSPATDQLQHGTRTAS